MLGQKPARGQMVYARRQGRTLSSRARAIEWLPSIYQRADINGRNFYRDFCGSSAPLRSIEEQLDAIHPYSIPTKRRSRSCRGWRPGRRWCWKRIGRCRRSGAHQKAIELYRIRGTVKGLKLFISLFTGHEPDVKRTVGRSAAGGSAPRRRSAPTRGAAAGQPGAHLHRRDAGELQATLARGGDPIHEIIQMEKPANTQYYLRFASEGGGTICRSSWSIGARSSAASGSASRVSDAHHLQRRS